MPRLLRAAALIAAAGVAAYAANTALEWLLMGRGPRRRLDELLDRYLPSFDVEERHRIFASASPAASLSAMRDLGVHNSSIAQALFRVRAMLMGASGESHMAESAGFIDAARSLGWEILDEQPGERIVMGAVTRPWEADVVFHGLPADQFIAFDQPGFIKIMWTLRSEPRPGGAWLITETRAYATDAAARARFRRYWPLVSPGTRLIRLAALWMGKRKAEGASTASALDLKPAR